MPDRNLPTGTVTFLFSDIEGSTRLLQAVGRDTFSGLLESHHEIFRANAGDAVVSTEGDSFFCAFATPGAAVAAAVGVQRALGDHDWPEGADIRVRMGIHTGEGVLGGDNYVGLDVHAAARIASAAHGGQVLLSDATRAQVAHSLPQGVGLRDLGEHRLKDLAHPEHLFQLTIPGHPDDFPPPKSIEASPTNLPEHLSSFVGRGSELQAALDALAGARLVTLVGPGGAGKTRLAIEAGRDSRSRFPGGVYMASLGDISEPELVATHVASELSVPEQVGRSIEQTLIDYLMPKRLLLVLDNCEHLADAAAALAERLLQACSELTVLATSREPLLIVGEQLYELGPMQLPDSPDEALESDAVLLFTARARESNPAFDVGEWAKECANICVRLDGIPLAIELAAARTSMLTPREILARLEDRFGLLTSRSRTASARHGTLEAAIDWSYDLLGDDAQRLLRTLAVFRGGFTLDAARVVCFGEEVGDGVVLDHLTELRDKSLLTQTTTHAGTRFGLLETIREYAAVRLHRMGEFEEVERRHREYHTALARSEALRLGGSEQLEALAALEADHDNFRAVMRRACDAGDLDAAADMAGWLSWFWYVHAHFTEGDHWAGRLLAAVPDDPGRPWLRLLVGAAQFAYRIGHYDEADARLRVALQVAEQQRIPRMEMWAHAYIATNELYRTRLEVAAPEARRALELAEELGDFIGLAYATFLDVSVEAWMSSAETDLDSERAQSLLTRLGPVADGARAIGERNMVGHVLQAEGILSSFLGHEADAARAFDEAVTALTELGTVGCACHCLEAVAEFVAMRGDVGAAARIIGATDALRAGIGITVAPVEERFRAHAVALCAEALRPERLESATSSGSAMSLAEAAQFARQTLARV